MKSPGCFFVFYLKLLNAELVLQRSFIPNRRLLGHVSDHVLINRASKERALHQAIKYSPDAI